MSISKPSTCFWKWVISVKWRNKLVIHNINLTGHRKSGCCLQLLFFLKIWVIAPGNPVFSQKLLQPWSQNVLWNWVKKYTFEYYGKYEVKMIRILFKFIIYPSCERALKNGRVTWFFWLHMIIYDQFSSVFCIVPRKVLLLKYWKWFSH